MQGLATGAVGSSLMGSMMGAAGGELKSALGKKLIGQGIDIGGSGAKNLSGLSSAAKSGWTNGGNTPTTAWSKFMTDFKPIEDPTSGASASGQSFKGLFGLNTPQTPTLQMPSMNFSQGPIDFSQGLEGYTGFGYAPATGQLGGDTEDIQKRGSLMDAFREADFAKESILGAAGERAAQRGRDYLGQMGTQPGSEALQSLGEEFHGLAEQMKYSGPKRTIGHERRKGLLGKLGFKDKDAPIMSRRGELNPALRERGTGEGHYAIQSAYGGDRDRLSPSSKAAQELWSMGAPLIQGGIDVDRTMEMRKAERATRDFGDDFEPLRGLAGEELGELTAEDMPSEWRRDLNQGQSSMYLPGSEESPYEGLAGTLEGMIGDRDRTRMSPLEHEWYDTLPQEEQWGDPRKSRLEHLMKTYGGMQMGGAVSNPIPYNLGGSVYQQPMQYQLGGLLKYRSPM
jgi:hypothetical protein